MSTRAKGSCLCGSVRYQICETPTDCCVCHCSVCRRLTGSAMGVYGSIAKTDFKWIAGESTIKSYQQTKHNQRLFCPNCGSCVISLHSLAPSRMYLSLGCLEDSSNLRIDYQQFVDSKAQWSSIDQSITQYSAWPDWIHQKIEQSIDLDISHQNDEGKE